MLIKILIHIIPSKERKKQDIWRLQEQSVLPRFDGAQHREEDKGIPRFKGLSPFQEGA